jgi:DNA-binding CsgD family transcriptional regulator
MDWSAVASLIAERAGLSVVLLGDTFQLLFVSPAAERALGWSTNDEAPTSIERYLAPGAARGARLALDRAMTGALRRLEVRVITPQGNCVASFDVGVVGRADGQGMLLTLEHLAPLSLEQTQCDYDYEVSGVTSGEYRLLNVWQPGFQGRGETGKCFEVLHGRREPCEKCPLSRSETRRPAVSISPEAPHEYVLTTASDLEEARARVSVRHVSAASLSAVMHARLDELAERAHLSRRERSVFTQLMEGRAVDEIAIELSISPRTVKFHQANVLQKLGADSRTDLIRLVF